MVDEDANFGRQVPLLPVHRGNVIGVLGAPVQHGHQLPAYLLGLEHPSFAPTHPHTLVETAVLQLAEAAIGADGDGFIVLLKMPTPLLAVLPVEGQVVCQEDQRSGLGHAIGSDQKPWFWVGFGLSWQAETLQATITELYRQR